MIDVLIQGMLYGIMSMGVMISYKILDIPDLSVDGTYPLGVAISAILIINGVNPWLALIISMLGGFLAGIVTGYFHVKFGISSLLSGILVMTGLYSINLMIAGGKSNLPLFKFDTLFAPTWLENRGIPSFIIEHYDLIVLILLVVVIKVFIDSLLTTRLGYLLRVTGDNEGLVTSLGENLGNVKIIGLGIANAIVALSGGVAASVGRYFDISLGTGMIVLGLSSVILGTTLFSRFRIKLTTKTLLGAILYRFIIALALRFNMDPQHLKLATVIIFVGVMMLNKSSVAKYLGKGSDNHVKV